MRESFKANCISLETCTVYARKLLRHLSRSNDLSFVHVLADIFENKEFYFISIFIQVKIRFNKCTISNTATNTVVSAFPVVLNDVD